MSFSTILRVAMGSWQVTLRLGDDSTAPIFRRIAAALAAEIARDRLRPGERLPSSRALSAQLGVSRKTVVAAYEELRSLRVVGADRSRGTFVAQRPEPPSVTATRARARPGFDLPEPEVPEPGDHRGPGLLLLLGGVPELRFLPQIELSRAYRSALRSAGSSRLTDYADPQGDERLRIMLGDLLARVRGIPAPPRAICVVRGSQGGIYLAARALIRPGDLVAVEEYGFQPAWQALRLAGAQLCPVRVDGDGMDVDALDALAGERRLRAIYLTPHHQYPTTVSLAPARRRRLLDLARRQRLIVLEDDYDFDFHYDGKPILPLAAEDTAGVVVYFGTLSKSLAPGLRLGYVVAAPEVIARIAAYRFFVDRQGDHVLERAVALLLEDGVVQRHARRACVAYASRRDALCEALHRELPTLVFTPPRGGMAVWAGAPGIDVDAWAERARSRGVAFQTARRFTFDGAPRAHVRLGFAACNEKELAEAARRLAASL